MSTKTLTITIRTRTAMKNKIESNQITTITWAAAVPWSPFQVLLVTERKRATPPLRISHSIGLQWSRCEESPKIWIAKDKAEFLGHYGLEKPRIQKYRATRSSIHLHCTVHSFACPALPLCSAAFIHSLDCLFLSKWESEWLMLEHAAVQDHSDRTIVGQAFLNASKTSKKKWIDSKVWQNCVTKQDSRFRQHHLLALKSNGMNFVDKVEERADFVIESRGQRHIFLFWRRRHRQWRRRCWWRCHGAVFGAASLKRERWL